jgi:hypothetical protein
MRRRYSTLGHGLELLELMAWVAKNTCHVRVSGVRRTDCLRKMRPHSFAEVIMRVKPNRKLAMAKKFLDQRKVAAWFGISRPHSR